ncbi:MAG: hypothetical protein Kow00109_04880 [Acidobacteriota bacterium]
METDAPFVLIAEDMPAVAEPLAFALRHAGFEVVVAADGLEVLERIDERKPDVVLLDLAMPRMDGLACLRNIRQAFSREELPVIVLSAHSEQELVLEAARLGIEAYLLKSAFSLHQLVELVAKVVGTEGRVLRSGLRGEAAGASHQHGGAAGFRGQPSPLSEPEETPGPVVSRFASSGWLDPGGSEPLIPQQELLTRLRALQSPRGFKPAIVNLLRIIEHPEATLDQIVDAAALDQALASRLLWLANSAAYSRGAPVTSVRTAILRIGTERIREIALTLGLMERFGNGRQMLLHYGRFWEHSVAVATLAAEIVHRAPPAAAVFPPDVAFTAGLLHDLGRLVLVEEFETAYAELVEQSLSRRIPLFELELKRLPMTHVAVAERMLFGWRFSREVVRPVALHHGSWSDVLKLPPEERISCSVVILADTLAHALLLGESGNETFSEVRPFLSVVGLAQEEIPSLVRAVVENWRDIRTVVTLAAERPWPDRWTLVQKKLRPGGRPRRCPVGAEWSVVDVCLERLFSGESTGSRDFWVACLDSVDRLPACLEAIEEKERVEQRRPLPLLLILGEDGPVSDFLQGRPRAVAVAPFPLQWPSLVGAINACVAA